MTTSAASYRDAQIGSPDWVEEGQRIEDMKQARFRFLDRITVSALDRNLREHMSGKELAAVMLSEEIARERIDQTDARGNEPCAIECNTAARRVRSIL